MPPVYRQCPMCLDVQPATAFKRADERPVYGALRLTRCPNCQRVGVFRSFRRVEPPGDDGWGPVPGGAPKVGQGEGIG